MKAISRLNFNPDMRHGYIEGYRRAATFIAVRMINEHRDLDYLVYPLGHLYRHHVELQLKFLIATLGDLESETPSAPHTHKLRALWNQLRPKLYEMQPGADDFLREIDKGIDLLVDRDESSQEFRYHQYGPQNRASLEKIRYVDVEEFSNACETLASLLEAVNNYLIAELDVKREFDTWYQKDYLIEIRNSGTNEF